MQGDLHQLPGDLAGRPPPETLGPDAERFLASLRASNSPVGKIDSTRDRRRSSLT